MSICSNCKQELRKKARFCNNCGEKVNSYKISSASGDTEKNEVGITNCPYCKEEFRADSEFCGGCGRHIYLTSKNEALLQPDKDLSSNVDSAAYWNARGIDCFLGGDYGQAIKYFDKALEIDPYYSTAIDNKRKALPHLDKTNYLFKGLLLCKQQKYGEAIKCFDKALEIDPEFKSAWNSKGMALYRQGEDGEAIKCFDKALEIDPEYVDPWHNKGIALNFQQKYGEAIKCYDKALELNPDYYQAEDGKKEALLQIGKEDNLSISSKPGIFEFSTLGLPDFEETSLLWFSYNNELIYYQGNKETKLYPSDEDWERLWEIMEQIQAWEWHEKYEQRNVFDGNSWSLTIKYKDKYLKCSGSNDYPYGFKQFRGCISSLIDCSKKTTPEKVEKDWIEEGHKHYEEGRYRDALACYNHVAGGYRRQCLYLTTLRKNKGNCYIKLNEYDNAINWYYKWLKYKPNNEYALKAKAEVERLKKQLMTSSSNPIEPEMVYIEGGTFQMGNNYGPGYESPEHKVTVSSFYIGKYKVTNREYKAYDPAHRGCGWGDDLPVESVNWYNAAGYCEWLSSKTGKNYRLPTEAEWEYACRAGSKTAYYWGDSISDAYEYCWTYMDTFMNTNPVGEKLPNAWGLYDMSGNVGEWCSDWYGHYPDYPQINPTGPDTGSYRVYRGISPGEGRRPLPDPSRSGERNRHDPGDIDENIGFRLVKTP